MDTSVRSPDADLPGISIIGEELTITGNVASTGELHVNGRIQGNVHCLALVLGENAQLEGNVVAEDVMLRGRHIGSVRALRVMLQSQAHVEGDLFHKSLAIEQGAHFEGESHPSEDPLSVSPEAPTVEPQLNQNRGDSVNQGGSAKGFIRSLPELLRA